MRDIRESDWKRLRRLKAVALDRLCQRILAELQAAATAPSQTNHERYGTIYGLIRERDKEVARMFDDLRRSNALSRLAQMRFAGLITDEELAEFSEEAQESVAIMVGE